jgi:hypothetical protein
MTRSQETSAIDTPTVRFKFCSVMYRTNADASCVEARTHFERAPFDWVRVTEESVMRAAAVALAAHNLMTSMVPRR